MHVCILIIDQLFPSQQPSPFRGSLLLVECLGQAQAPVNQLASKASATATMYYNSIAMYIDIFHSNKAKIKQIKKCVLYCQMNVQYSSS